MKKLLALLLTIVTATSWSGICDSLMANFTYDVYGGSVHLTNTTTGEGAPTTYSWSYGSSSSSMENPTFTVEVGYVPVCLTVVSYLDSVEVCTSYMCDTIYYADTTGTDPCDELHAEFSYFIAGDNIYFTNESTGAGTGVSYYWLVGTEVSYEENPSFSTTSFGETETACLTISAWMADSTYCVDTLCMEIYFGDSTVTEDPCADFVVDFSYFVAGGNIYFSNETVGEGPTSYYTWWIGTEITNEENPVYPVTLFDTTDIACLTVETIFDSGVYCIDTVCMTFVTNDSTGSSDPCDYLNVDFSYYIEDGMIYFVNESSGTGGTTSYDWIVGSEVAYEENPSFPVDLFGSSETACLTVSTLWADSTFCIDTLCMTVYFDDSIADPCDGITADFAFYTDGDYVYFLDYSTTGGYPTDYDWEIYGDTYSEENPVVADSFTDSGYVCLTIVVFVDSSYWCTDTKCKAYEVFDSTVLGGTISEVTKVDIYPNPADDKVTISFGKFNTSDQLEIYNSYGQLVYTMQRTLGSKESTITVDEFPQGMYFLRMYNSLNPGTYQTERFIKR